MTDNDYIAEYIKEYRPEILTSLHFIFWKLGRSIQGIFSGFAKGLKDMDPADIESMKEKLAAGQDDDPDPEGDDGQC